MTGILDLSAYDYGAISVKSILILVPKTWYSGGR